MEALLKAYSIQDILIFLVLLAAAIKGAISFFDWAKDRLGKGYSKEYADKQNKKDLNEELQRENAAILKLEQNQAEMMQTMNNLANKIDALIDSDKDDIKSFLVREHHYFCYQKGWIDDYSLDCCERRFRHYVQEGGNSFIKDLMDEIRELPKQPPQA